MISIKEKELCCGCTACISACPKKCISMKADAEGFSYPIVDEDECIRCGLCEKVCPILNAKEESSDETKVFAVFANDDYIRRNSTSGGVFSLLAESIIQNGGYVFGCAFNSKFEVEHISVSEMGDIVKLQGSKYVQSNMKDSYVQIKTLLEDGNQVLFSGTPCQIEGLNSFLRKKYVNLFLVDIVCHGVPSPLIWEDYKNMQKQNNSSEIVGISFRNKDLGWKNYRVKIFFENGRVYSSRNWDDVYLKAYLKDLISRPSCYECKFRQWHREADITLADFWGIEQLEPKWNDDKGVSLIMVHSEKGMSMLADIETKIEKKEVAKESAVVCNPSIIHANSLPDERAEFWKMFVEKGYAKAMDKYVLDGFIGKVKRVVCGLLR